MEGDIITLQDVFLFDYGMGVDEHGRFQGHLKATGVRPKFAEKLADLGIRLGPEVFQPEAFARRASGGRMMRRALIAFAAGAGSLLLAAGGPALAQGGGSAEIGIRQVDATDPSPSRSRSSTGGERDVLSDLTVRENDEVRHHGGGAGRRPAVAGRRAPGRLVAVDGGERPHRAGARGRPRLRRCQGAHRPDRHRHFDNDVTWPGLHHGQGRAERGRRRHRAARRARRCRTASARRCACTRSRRCSPTDRVLGR